MPILCMQEYCHTLDIFITERANEKFCFNVMFACRVTGKFQSAIPKKFRVCVFKKKICILALQSANQYHVKGKLMNNAGG